MDGASTGTRMNTVETNDMTRAMRRPAYTSRTSAVETMRGPAAPKPASARPASNESEAVGERAQQVADDEKTNAEEQRGLSARAVRDGPVQQLPDRQATEESAEHELPIIGVGGAKLRGHRAQRGQHGVDRHCHQRRRERHERDEFYAGGGRHFAAVTRQRGGGGLASMRERPAIAATGPSACRRLRTFETRMTAKNGSKHRPCGTPFRFGGSVA